MKYFFNFLALGIATLLFILAISFSMLLVKHFTGSLMILIVLGLALVIYAVIVMMVGRYKESKNYLKTVDFGWHLAFTIIFVVLFFKLLFV